MIAFENNPGTQDPGGPHIGPMNIAIWEVSQMDILIYVPTASKNKAVSMTIFWLSDPDEVLSNL